MQIWIAINKKTGQQFTRTPTWRPTKMFWTTRGGLKCAIQIEYPHDVYRKQKRNTIDHEFMIIGYEVPDITFMQNERIFTSLPNHLIHYENYNWRQSVNTGDPIPAYY